MKNAAALIGSGIALLFSPCAMAQVTIFNNGGDGLLWNDPNNWSNGTPYTVGSGAQVQIGALPSQGGIELYPSDDTIASLTFNAGLGGSTLIQSAGSQVLTVTGSINNLSGFSQTLQLASLIANGNSTWNVGTGGLVVSALTIGTSQIAVTGSGGLQIVGSTNLNFGINSSTTYGKIGPITANGVTFAVSSTTNYQGTLGDFFQLATGTLSNISVDTSSMALGAGLSFDPNLINKGILQIQNTAGGQTINSGVVLPIDKDSEFWSGTNGTGVTTVTFNGTSSAAELLTDNSEDGNNTPFTTARNLIINPGSTSIIAAKTGTTATYTGVLSGTTGTLTIGDPTNTGTVVLATNNSTYSGPTTVAAGTRLEIGNTAGSATAGSVTLGAGNTITGISTGASIGGNLVLVGTDTVTTTAGSLATGGISVSGTGNLISGTVTGAATQAANSALAVNGSVSSDALGAGATLSGTGTVTGAVTAAGGTINGTGLVLTGGATFSGAGNTLAGTETGAVTVAGGGSLTQSATGTLTGALILGNGATTFTGTGATTVGAVTLNGGGNALAGTGTLTTSGITVNGTNNTISDTTTGAITQAANSSLAVNGTGGADTVGTGSTLSGTGTVGAVSLAGTDTLTSTGTLHTGGLTIAGAGNQISSGTIVGNATITGAGALADNGTLTGTFGVGTGTLTGTGTVTGAVTAAGGTINGTGLHLTSGATFSNAGNTLAGTETGAVTVAAGGALTQSATGTLTGALTLSNGAATFTGNGASTVGAVTLNGGGNALAGTGTLTTSGITVNGSGNTISDTTIGAITQAATSSLVVNGTGGADTVGTGSTLSGTGTVGAVTLAGTDTLTSTGTLHTGGITIAGAGNAISSGTIVGNATITGAGALADNGALTGTLAVGTGTLTGTGSISGATTVGGGTINGTGLVLTGGATFTGAGNTLAGTETGAVTVAGGGSLTQSATGTLTGALILGNGATTFTGTGATTVGAVTLNGGGNALAGTGTLTTSGITVNGTNNTISDTTTGAITQAANSSLAVNGTGGADTVGTGSTLSGTGTVGAVSLAGTDTLTSTGTLHTGGLTIAGAGNQISSGTIVGNATITGAGALADNGTLTGTFGVGTGTLTGTGTVTGAVTAAGGTINGTGLHLTSGATFSNAGNTLAGTETGAVTVAAGGALTQSATGTLTGALTLSNGAATFTGNGASTVGAVTLNGGGNALAGTGTLTTSGITVNGSGNTISDTTIGAITQAATSSLVVNGTGGADTVGTGSTLSGTGTVGAVTLAGTDTLTSTGTLHTGGITVNSTGNVFSAGTITGNTTLGAGAALVVNSNLTGTMTVGSGTLTGTGAISGATSVGSGGKIGSTSVATGTLSVGGLTTASGSSLNFGLASGGLGNESKIAVTSGTLNIGGTTTINLAQVGNGTLTSGFYSLLTYAGTASGLTNLTLGTTTLGGLTLTLDTSHTGQVGVDISAPNSTQNFSGTTPATINIITGATTTVSTTLNNTSTTATLAVNVADNGSTGGTVTGLTSSGGATVPTSGSTTITGTFTAGTVGTGKTYSISNTDPNAMPTTISTGGVVNVYNHATGTLSVTSATSVKAITGTSVASTLSFQNAGANNDNVTNLTGGTGVSGLSGTVTANQTVTGTGTTTAGAAGTTTTANYSSTYTEDQTVIGATTGTQTANAGSVTITNYNHAVGTLTVTSPTTVKAIAGSSVASTLTFANAGANNDNLTIQSVGTGVTGLSGTFTANQTNTTVTGTKTAGAAGSVTTATYTATYLEDQSVLGATTGNQTATSATVTIDAFSHAVGSLVVTSPTTLRAITGTTINSTLTFTNAGATNDDLIAGTAGGGLTAATGTISANQSQALTGSFVAGAAGSTTTNNFTQNYTEDQTVIGATTGTQTATAGVQVTAYGHSAPSLSSNADNVGFVHIGETVPNATTTLSNGTGNLAGLQIVSLGGLTDSGAGLIAAGTGRSLSAAVNTTTVGAINTVYTIQTEDDQTILGATANANQTFTVSGNVYSGQGVWNTNGSGSWGTINNPVNWTAAGGAPGLDANFTTTDTATFGPVVTAGTAVVSLNGDNPSLKAITFNDPVGGNYNIAQGSGGTLHLNAGAGNTATITNTHGADQISAPIELDSATAISVASGGDTLTISGPISGATANSLTLGAGGPGTIVLSGANTFTGATTITSGTVQFQSANALTSSSTVTQTGGTIDIDGHAQTLQNFSSTGGTITNTGALSTITFDIPADPVNNSDITGNVAVNKTGAGLLALTGANTYTGGTTITAGTLEAGSATAFGTGDVTNTGGTLGAYGAEHSINIGGNYVQAAGGTLFLNLNTDAPTSPNNDVLNVPTGTASLNGGLDIHFGFLPVKNDTFVVVTTGNGITTLGPGFITPTVVNQAGILVTGNLTNAGDDLTLTVTQAQLQLAPVLGSYATPNRTAILTALSDPSLAANDPTLFNILATLVTSQSAAALPASLADTADQFNPAKFGNFVQSTIVNNAVFNTQELDSYWESQRSAHGDFLTSNAKLDSSGLTVANPSMDPALAQIGTRLLAWSPASIGHGMLSDSTAPVLGGVDSKAMQPANESLSSNNFSAFVVGNVILAQNFSQSDVAHSDTTTGGVQMGVDYRLTPHLRAGVLFGYNHTDGTLDTNLSKATIDTYAPGAYVSYANSGWYANGVASYGFNSYTEDRHMSLLGASAVAHGAPSGDQITANIDGGYDFHANKLTYGPLVGLQYTHLSVDSYNEDGAEALGSNLAVGSQSGDSLRSRLGGHVSYVFQTGRVLLTPHLDVSWQHEFMDQAEGITAGVAGVPFTVTTQRPSRDSALIDGGVNADLNGTVSVFGDYLIQAGQSNYFGQSVQAGVKIGF